MPQEPSIQAVLLLVRNTDTKKETDFFFLKQPEGVFPSSTLIRRVVSTREATKLCFNKTVETFGLVNIATKTFEFEPVIFAIHQVVTVVDIESSEDFIDIFERLSQFGSWLSSGQVHRDYRKYSLIDRELLLSYELILGG